jgi:inosine-uridine nucleoside N-ribohydrolase
VPELVMMGGRLASGRAEFNFSAHPRATNLVLRAPAPKFMVTLDLCFQAAFTQAELSRLEGKPDRLIARYLPVLRRWLKLQRFLISLIRRRYPELSPGGFFPWDGIAAAYLAEPSLFSEIKPLKVWMGKNRVLSSEDLSGLDPRFAVRAPFRVDSRRFLDLFVERLGAYG